MQNVLLNLLRAPCSIIFPNIGTFNKILSFNKLPLSVNVIIQIHKIIAKIGDEVVTNFDVVNEINTLLALSNERVNKEGCDRKFDSEPVYNARTGVTKLIFI